MTQTTMDFNAIPIGSHVVHHLKTDLESGTFLMGQLFLY